MNSDNHSCRLVASLEDVTEFSRLLIDAHRSDAIQSFLIDLIPFSVSIHELVGHYTTQLSDLAVQGAELTPTVTLRVSLDQPIHQSRGTNIGLLLQPFQYLTPFPFEGVQTGLPSMRHP